MSGSGLKVNTQKTELVIFHRKDITQGILTIGQTKIKSKRCMNILGISFDSRLTWEDQIEKAIANAMRARQGIGLIRKFFTPEELCKIVTSMAFSRLYYGAEIWLVPSLKENLWRKLYSCSGRLLKTIDAGSTYEQLHKRFKRATPRMFCNYQTSICFYDVIKFGKPLEDYLNICNVVLNNRRNLFFTFTSNSHYRVGKNSIYQRLHAITNRIKKDWIEKSRTEFKIHCKEEFITNPLAIL
jgi:hypothetical protein